MDEKNTSAWLRVLVVDVKQGAKYQDIVYDQDLIVTTPTGSSLTLFDMTPMIAANVRPKDVLDVIVAIAAPYDLKQLHKSPNGIEGLLVSLDYEAPRNASARFRDELFTRRWCQIRTSMGNFLMAIAEIEMRSSGGLTFGSRFSWKGGRFDLMAWKYSP